MGDLGEFRTVCPEKGRGVRYQSCILGGRCSGNASTEERKWSEIKNSWQNYLRDWDVGSGPERCDYVDVFSRVQAFDVPLCLFP